MICVGKALGGGLPMSAALFLRPELEAVWELGPEDVLTHTHVGNPLACAAALVVLDEVPGLLDACVEAGERFERAGWHGAACCARGRATGEEAWRRGVLVVPAGAGGSLISATPPLRSPRGDRRGARAARVAGLVKSVRRRGVSRSAGRAAPRPILRRGTSGRTSSHRPLRPCLWMKVTPFVAHAMPRPRPRTGDSRPALGG